MTDVLEHFRELADNIDQEEDEPQEVVAGVSLWVTDDGGVIIDSPDMDERATRGVILAAAILSE